MRLKKCFDINMRTNSIGARDIERETRASKNRVIVVGDSFIEGWGLERDQRLTHQLEKNTNVEHLNFGMSHFSTYQEYLVYKHFSKKFDHSALIIGLLPTNDFLDNNLNLTKDSLPNYRYRYRPYLIKDSGKWVHFNYTENSIIRFLRSHSHSYRALQALFQSSSSVNNGYDESDTSPSNFYDYDKQSLKQLTEILKLFRIEAEDKKIVVVIIPVEEDLIRFEQEKDTVSPLYKNLLPVTSSLDIKLISLLPFFHQKEVDTESFYHECDYHWNAWANEISAEYLSKELQGFIYK